MDQLTEEQRQEFAVLFRDARTARNLKQYEVAQATGVNQNTIGTIERSGPFLGLRAIDLLRLISYYGLDVFQVSTLLGVTVGTPLPVDETPLARQARTIARLPPEDQQYVVGVVDVFLRGLRRR